MAKLQDAKAWLAEVLGDPKRATTLINRGRDQGILSKGKRGGTAPDLLPLDATALLGMVLSAAPPAQVGPMTSRFLASSLTGVWIESSVDHRNALDIEAPLPKHLLKPMERAGLTALCFGPLKDVLCFRILSALLIRASRAGRFPEGFGLRAEERGGAQQLTLSLGLAPRRVLMEFGTLEDAPGGLTAERTIDPKSLAALLPLLPEVPGRPHSTRGTVSMGT